MSYHTLSGKIVYVYILANYNRNVIYIGVTDDLIERVWDHKQGKGCNFTKKYNIKYLLYYEEYPNINEAIAREKQLKNWRRAWKFNLIKKVNPNMKDLWKLII